MSDAELRELERAYQASGAEEDREAWLHAQARAAAGDTLLIELRQTVLAVRSHPVEELGAELAQVTGRWSQALLALDGVCLFDAQMLDVVLQLHEQLRARRGALGVVAAAPWRRTGLTLRRRKGLHVGERVDELLAGQGWSLAARVWLEVRACD